MPGWHKGMTVAHVRVSEPASVLKQTKAQAEGAGQRACRTELGPEAVRQAVHSARSLPRKMPGCLKSACCHTCVSVLGYHMPNCLLSETENVRGDKHVYHISTHAS